VIIRVLILVVYICYKKGGFNYESKKEKKAKGIHLIEFIENRR